MSNASLKVRILVLRNGATMQSSEPETLTVKRITAKYRTIERSLPKQFTFRIESVDRKVIWIGKGQHEEKQK